MTILLALDSDMGQWWLEGHVSDKVAIKTLKEYGELRPPDDKFVHTNHEWGKWNKEKTWLTPKLTSEGGAFPVTYVRLCDHKEDHKCGRIAVERET